MILQDFGYHPTFKPFYRDNDHSYWHTTKKLRLIGTTTVIGMKDKPFLKPWASKLCSETIGNDWDETKTYTKEEKEAILLKGKNAHAQKTQKACDSGSIGHYLIEMSINGNNRYCLDDINENIIRAYIAENNKKEVEYTDKEVKQLTKEAKVIYQNWLDWSKTHEIEYYATELIVGSENSFTGGTIDAIALVDGFLELLDWKTSSQLSDDVVLQSANYKRCLLEGGVNPNIRRRVVRFDKEKSLFEDKLIGTNYDTDIECFDALLKVYRWDRDIAKENPLDRKQFKVGKANYYKTKKKK